MSSVDTRRQILDTARRLIACKGFTAVGLSEILAAAGVPKGSFYHWFRSKEHFGEALLDRHFDDCLAHVDAALHAAGMTAGERLLAYFGEWHGLQSGTDAGARCLVVKLGAEVCDLSEPMRASLERGTARLLALIAECIASGQSAGEFSADVDAADTAQQLYQQWLGATLLARVQNRAEPLDRALARTRHWVAAHLAK